MPDFYLQVVEDEKECFCGQSLVELYGVRVVRRYLMMEGQGGTWIPHQVLPCGQKHRHIVTDINHIKTKHVKQQGHL